MNHLRKNTIKSLQSQQSIAMSLTVCFVPLTEFENEKSFKTNNECQLRIFVLMEMFSKRFLRTSPNAAAGVNTPLGIKEASAN